jgi:hypothetical protein
MLPIFGPGFHLCGNQSRNLLDLWVDHSSPASEGPQASSDKLRHRETMSLGIPLGEFEIALGQAYGQLDGLHGFSLTHTARVRKISRGVGRCAELDLIKELATALPVFQFIYRATLKEGLEPT